MSEGRATDLCFDWGNTMRDSSKRSPSQIAELLRSGGGVRAVKVILCVALFAAAAMAQSSTSYGIDTFAGVPAIGDGGPAAEPWCGGHYIDWRGSEPKTFFSPKHEDGTAPVVEPPAWLIWDRWDALVFDAYDRAEPLDQTTVLRREDVAGMRVCVQSPEASDIGKHLEPYANREWWRFHIRRWTGVSWGGELRIAECRGEAPNGWVYVRAAEGYEIGFGAAFAHSRRESHPHGAGRWLASDIVFQPEPTNPTALEPLAFEGILAHELGHVMGFSHVPVDLPRWIMQVPETRPWPEDESQHAQLAYQVGPNVRYPGLTPPSSLSNDATLRRLELVARPADYHLTGFVHPLGLIPAFDSAIQSYTATAPNDATDVVLTARANNDNATVTVNGVALGRGVESDPIDLEVGENVFFEVVVTAQDGTTMLTYTAEVARSGGVGVLTVPSAPRNLTAVGGNGLAVLRWDAPENDGGSAIADYEYRIDRRDPWISIGSTNTTHTVTGLTNGTVYVFQVRAVNSAGASPASGRAEATPEEAEDRIYYFPHLAVGAGLANHDHLYQLLPAGGELPDRFPFRSGKSADGLLCGTGRGAQPDRRSVARGIRSPGDQRGAERSPGARLGAGHLFRAGEGQPSVSSAQQGRGAHSRSRSQCDDRSGHPLCHLCRTGRRAVWDRSGLCQPFPHGGPGHFYRQGRVWADAGQRRSGTAGRRAWCAKYGASVWSQQLYRIA